MDRPIVVASFTLFGPDHLAALGILFGASAVLVALGRRARPRPQTVDPAGARAGRPTGSTGRDPAEGAGDARAPLDRPRAAPGTSAHPAATDRAPLDRPRAAPDPSAHPAATDRAPLGRPRAAPGPSVRALTSGPPRLGGPRAALDLGVRAALFLGLALGVGLHLHQLAGVRPLELLDLLPLHLCDFSILLAAWALVRPSSRFVTEVLFLWTSTGTLLAAVTPALHHGFPDPRFVTYFLLHGGVICAAVYLVLGRGAGLRPGAPGRVWGFTGAYAAVVAGVDLALGENYLYLLHPPSAPTLLDAFGPWPVYLAVVAVLARALFGVVAWLTPTAIDVAPRPALTPSRGAGTPQPCGWSS